MKKYVKTLISIILALMFSLGALTAFAAGDTLSWYYGENIVPDDYYSGGELALGENKIAPVNKNLEDGEADLVYYKFDAESAGYYALTCTSTDSIYASVAEELKTDGIYGMKEGFGFENNDTEENSELYYFDEGINVIGLYYSFSPYKECTFDDCVIRIDYYGEKITDFEVENESVTDYVIGYDIPFEAVESDLIPVKGELNFSSGKKIKLDRYIDCEIKNKPVDGENTVTLNILDYKKDITITAYKIEHFIESMELKGVEKFTELVVDYRGIEEPVNEHGTLVVKYTDGKTKELDYNYYAKISIAGDREYYVSGNYTNNEDGTINFEIVFAGKVFVSEPCNKTNADFNENSEIFKSTVWYYFSFTSKRIKIFLDKAFSLESEAGVKERAAYIGVAIRQAYDFICCMMNNISAFVEFYSPVCF